MGQVTQQAWEASVASRCWWYTAYDAGWEHSAEYGHDLREDAELAAIVAGEQALGPLPEWVVRVIEGPLRFVPACGHADFPLAYVDLLRAMGSGEWPRVIHGCYTASPARKRRLADLVFCLDAWSAGASADDAARELSARRADVADWSAVCPALWEVLGAHDEVRDLLIERVIHRQRWWLKTMVWDDDARDAFGADAYLGDVRGSRDTYGNAAFGDPYFAEPTVPRVALMEQRLARVCPDWDWFRERIHSSWLCAPKAFRFLEVLLWSIGRGRPRADGEPVPAFLGVSDTWRPHDEVRDWWRSYLTALDAWWRTPTPADSGVTRPLGEWTPTKAWLVRLAVHRLRVHARDSELRRWVGGT